MREPRAIPIEPQTGQTDPFRKPKAFASEAVAETPDVFESEADDLDEAALAPEPKRKGRFWRTLALATGSALISLGLGLAAERLIRDLFAAYDWLGWVGLGLLAVFVIALLVLSARELLGLARLRTLDRLRAKAASALLADDLEEARHIEADLQALYDERPDLARARSDLAQDRQSILDGAELVKASEAALMVPLDAKARALTVASARRVALVTAVAPRAIIDITFVVFESLRLARNIADLYGARPGFFGFMRLMGAILSHLAVTGGLVLTDGVVEQLLGHGVATRLSARLGEGLLNGLMTVRVGIAAMKVVRPLPYATKRAPVVSDFVAELVKVANKK